MADGCKATPIMDPGIQRMGREPQTMRGQTNSAPPTVDIHISTCGANHQMCLNGTVHINQYSL